MTTSGNDWANYGLYQDPYVSRVHRAVDKVLLAQKEKYTPEDFTPFDSMHYCDHRYVEAFFNELPQEHKIKALELCSGCGSTARFVFTKFNVDLTCIDFLEGFNGINRRINDLCGFDIKVHQGDASALEHERIGVQGDADAVYSIQSLLHVVNKPGTFESCNKALKVGGKLYIEDFTLENDLPRSEEELAAQAKLRFDSCPTQAEYTAFLEDAGFRVDSYIHRTREWSIYVYERAERFLREKEAVLAEHGEDVWNGRYMSAIHNTTKLYHDLGMTLEEAKQTYPLTFAELGEETFKKWVQDTPQKYGGSYITATKIREL
jgi:SAM-dependent methyltransferase